MTEFVIDFHVTGEYGMNKIYAGVHWTKRQRQANFIHLLVRSELQRQKVRKHIYKKRVRLEFYYNTRLDVSNHGYITKLIEDSLKGYFFIDDSRKYVKAISQEFWDGEGIKVIIKEVKE